MMMMMTRNWYQTRLQKDRFLPEVTFQPLECNFHCPGQEGLEPTRHIVNNGLVGSEFWNGS